MKNSKIKSRSVICLTASPGMNSLIGRVLPDRSQNRADYVGVAPDLYARKYAFTLVELLVVVLIIGILSAIAIPMYQGAVDKSHWSTMLPGAKAIKDAEEAIKMTNGSYTDNMANLDVTMNNADLTFALLTPNNTADPNVIRVTNSKLANVRLASYLDDSPKFAGQLHCEALKNDERANKLCSKLLMGQELTEQDGYVGYLLDQDITKEICGNASRSWSSTKTKCYKTTAERCQSVDVTGGVASNNDQCIYTNNRNVVQNGGGCKELDQGSICIGDDGAVSCNSFQFDEGACISTSGRTCMGNIFTNGSVCVSNAQGLYGWGGCAFAVFTNGSICYANAPSSCGNHYQDTETSLHNGNAGGMGSGSATSYDETSCCCGAYCGKAPSCASRGITCDPYYMDPNNFKDL